MWWGFALLSAAPPTFFNVSADPSPSPGSDLLSWFDVDAWQNAPDQPVVTPLRRTVPQQVEVWLRHPHNYMNAVEATPFSRYVFYASDVKRREVNCGAMLKNLLPKGMPHEWIVVTGSNATVWSHTDLRNPQETVPVWKFGDEPANLLRLCQQAPQRGWSRIVVGILARNKMISIRERQRLHEWLHRVATSYPEVRLHLTGTNSFAMNFGLNMAAADFDPGTGTQMGHLRLPNGKVIPALAASRQVKWLHVLGYSAAQVRDDRDCRIGLNMRSAMWAAEHWNDPEGLKPVVQRKREDPFGLVEGRSRTVAGAAHRAPPATLMKMWKRPPLDADMYPQMGPDPFEPYAYAEPVTNMPLVPIRPRDKDNGDRIVCNACTLSPKCGSFREGAVCSLPSSPGKSLADMFATRDADVIREALGVVLSKQTERYERAAFAYREDEESDVLDIRRSEHLMKMENSLVRSAEALVKILDPTFRQSNVPAIANSVTHVYNPKVLVADVIKQLEASGVPRASIEPTKIIEMARERGMVEE